MIDEAINNASTEDESFIWEIPDDDLYPVRTVFQRFGKKTVEQHALTSQQVSILNLIAHCKTGALGYNAAYCPECDKYIVHACSCNNRECPNCQSLLEEAWIEERAPESLPGTSYFHVVFTLPAPVVELFQYNKDLLYPLLSTTASRTVVEQAQGLRHNGFTPGVITVTHPGGSKMNFRPHIHMIVSGGGLNPFGQFRTTSRKEFFLPLPQLGTGFRGRFLSKLKELYRDGKLFLPESLIDPADPYGFQSFVDSLFRITWLPFIKETFTGRGVEKPGKSKGNGIRYLARYLFRTGISNSRITRVTDTEVYYTYTDYKDEGKKKETSLPGPEFVWFFLNLIMPPRCPKVRYYGMMANSVKKRCLTLAFQLLSAIYSPVRLHGNGTSTRGTMLLLHGVDIGLCPWCRKTQMIRMPHILVGQSTIYTPREQIQREIQELRRSHFPSV